MARPASLRLATHNVNGLVGPGRAARAALLWQTLRLDVVAVQETHLNMLTAPRIDPVLRARGYRAIWSHGPSAAGVALVLRQSLLSSGELDLDETAVQRPWHGRLLHVPATWAGHKLQLASVYLPSGDSAEQRRAIQAFLTPLAQLPGAHVWGGDYNFVDCPTLDRLRGGGLGTPVLQLPGGQRCLAGSAAGPSGCLPPPSPGTARFHLCLQPHCLAAGPVLHLGLSGRLVRPAL